MNVGVGVVITRGEVRTITGRNRFLALESPLIMEKR
jgi:hypothetical protein